jgi:hypothetical protein
MGVNRRHSPFDPKLPNSPTLLKDQSMPDNHPMSVPGQKLP